MLLTDFKIYFSKVELSDSSIFLSFIKEEILQLSLVNLIEMFQNVNYVTDFLLHILFNRLALVNYMRINK